MRRSYLGKVEPELRSHSLLNRLIRNRVDKLLLLNALSKLPNFRWCLGPDCNSGGLFEMGSETPKIMCGDCAFVMCFQCDVVWHTGLSCDQFENQRRHGDPQFAETQAFIESNTKPCPGLNCTIRVEKGDGCFHMSA